MNAIVRNQFTRPTYFAQSAFIRNYSARGNARPHPGLLQGEGEFNPVAEWVHRFVMEEHVVKISPFGKRERAGVRVFIQVNSYG